jgi:hypothetical protein
MAQALVAGLSPRMPGFVLRSAHEGFVVDKVALEQVSLRVFRFYPVNIIPPWLSILIYITRGTNNSSVGGRSSET